MCVCVTSSVKVLKEQSVDFLIRRFLLSLVCVSSSETDSGLYHRSIDIDSVVLFAAGVYRTTLC